MGEKSSVRSFFVPFFGFLRVGGGLARGLHIEGQMRRTGRRETKGKKEENDGENDQGGG